MLDQFDRVYVINLNRRPDRLREMRTQLRSIGQDFGDRIRRISASTPRAQGGFRSIGAHGCFLSHLRCISKAAADGARNLLILEDDVDFEPRFEELQAPLRGVIARGDWDLLYGGFRLDDGALESGTTMYAPGLREVSPETPICTAHFFAVNGPRIAELRDYMQAMLLRPYGDVEGGPMDVDGAYSWYRRKHDVRTLIADPQLGHQRATSSDITPRWFDRYATLALVANLVRRTRKKLQGQ